VGKGGKDGQRLMQGTLRGVFSLEGNSCNFNHGEIFMQFSQFAKHGDWLKLQNEYDIKVFSEPLTF
jgi:hypothetical protein